MTVGSLFSGIGGMELGLERAGMEVAWQVEYDAQARSVLRKHWPNADIHEDVRNVGRSDLAPVDLICGGFPCQDLSVAGRRAGLAGERSGLFYEFMRIVDELAPRWVLIENVPGLLSSNGGRDMGAVLGTLGELGYGWTYRVLDTQYFGPPQRRKRVFIVGCAGGFCPPEVLLEPESLPWNPAPSREAREGSTQCSEDGAGGVGSVARTIPARMDGSPCVDRGPEIVVANTLPTKYRGDPHEGTDTLIAFDTTQITSRANRSHPRAGDTGHPLAAGAHPPSIASGFDWTQTGAMPYEELSPTLRVGSGLGIPSPPAVAFNGDQSAKTRSMGETVEGCPSLRTVGGTHVSVPAPRRLTPRECERLQGFPDDWTRWDHEGNELADSPRYRMLGNAVSVPVAEWIGRQLLQARAA